MLFGEELIAPGYDGINELTISNAAYLSAWNGSKEIEIPFNIEEFENLLSLRIKNSNNHQSQSISSSHEEYSSRWDVRW